MQRVKRLCRKPEGIAERLGVSLPLIERVLTGLEETGLEEIGLASV